MTERTWKCPNCGASLAPSRFARTATCPHCGTAVQIDEQGVSAARFRQAFAAWTTPDPSRSGDAMFLGAAAWTSVRLVAQGEIADMELVERVRWPPQRALLKVLRDPADHSMLEAEWNALESLHASQLPGAGALSALVPQPLAFDVIRGGPHAGAHASLLRYVPGFDHTIESVRAAFPRGMDPRAGVWMWRRVLEALTFVHRAGLVHGAVLPPHLIVERGEHGVRLVGFGCAGAPGAPLAAVLTRYEGLYPPDLLRTGALAPMHDVRMSARSVGFALGADAEGRLPAGVPAPLRDLLEGAGAGEGGADAWALRERVGQVAAGLYGPPSFHPLVLP